MRKIKNIVDKLTTPICQKNGFVTASILLDWERIVGSSFNQYCTPEKVVFPTNKRNMGTIYLKTPSYMAPEISYLEPIIIEKINGYYGYMAVAKIVIRHGPLQKNNYDTSKVKRLLSKQHQEELAIAIENIADEELKESLKRLGEGIMLKTTEY